jgi:hypothetical protein
MTDDLDEPYSITEREAEIDAAEQLRYGDPVPVTRLDAAARALRNAVDEQQGVGSTSPVTDILRAVAGSIEDRAAAYREHGYEAKRLHPTFHAVLEAAERLAES